MVLVFIKKAVLCKNSNVEIFSPSSDLGVYISSLIIFYGDCVINKVIHGDCFEYLDTLKEHTIDLIFADPPYGITECEWDVEIDLKLFWEKVYRVSKIDTPMCVMSVQPFTSKLILSNEKDYKYDWIWKKHKSSNFPQSNNRPLKFHEFISVFYQNQPYYNPQKIPRKSKRVRQAIENNTKPIKRKNSIVSLQLNPKKDAFVDTKQLDPDWAYPDSFLFIPAIVSNSKERTGHSTQKPVTLYEYFLKTYTKKGDVVLDPFGGSGTMAEACLNLKRNFIVIEKEKDFVDMTLKRIDNHYHYSNEYTIVKKEKYIEYEIVEPFADFM